MTRRLLTALAGAATTLAIVLPGAPAAGPSAQKSGEELGAIITTGKQKAKSPINYQVQCGAPAPAQCSVAVRSTFVLKGPNIAVSTGGGIFAAGEIGTVVLAFGKEVKNRITDNLKSSKLRAKLTVTNFATGEVDQDIVTFKFKK